VIYNFIICGLTHESLFGIDINRAYIYFEPIIIVLAELRDGGTREYVINVRQILFHFQTIYYYNEYKGAIDITNHISYIRYEMNLYCF